MKIFEPFNFFEYNQSHLQYTNAINTASNIDLLSYYPASTKTNPQIVNAYTVQNGYALYKSLQPRNFEGVTNQAYWKPVQDESYLLTPEYTPGVVYSVGTLVKYGSGFFGIYKCIQQTTGTEDPTNTAYWEYTALSNRVSLFNHDKFGYTVSYGNFHTTINYIDSVWFNNPPNLNSMAILGLKNFSKAYITIEKWDNTIWNTDPLQINTNQSTDIFPLTKICYSEELDIIVAIKEAPDGGRKIYYISNHSNKQPINNSWLTHWQLAQDLDYYGIANINKIYWSKYYSCFYAIGITQSTNIIILQSKNGTTWTPCQIGGSSSAYNYLGLIDIVDDTDGNVWAIEEGTLWNSTDGTNWKLKHTLESAGIFGGGGTGFQSIVTIKGSASTTGNFLIISGSKGYFGGLTTDPRWVWIFTRLTNYATVEKELEISVGVFGDQKTCLTYNTYEDELVASGGRRLWAITGISKVSEFNSGSGTHLGNLTISFINQVAQFTYIQKLSYFPGIGLVIVTKNTGTNEIKLIKSDGSSTSLFSPYFTWGFNSYTTQNIPIYDITFNPKTFTLKFTPGGTVADTWFNTTFRSIKSIDYTNYEDTLLYLNQIYNATNLVQRINIYFDLADINNPGIVKNILFSKTNPEIGTLNFGINLGITDYSKKETDEFGNTTFVERAYINTATLPITIKDTEIISVRDILTKLRARTVLWIGSEDKDYKLLLFFGYYKDFSIDISYPEYSNYSLTIESLSEI